MAQIKYLVLLFYQKLVKVSIKYYNKYPVRHEKRNMVKNGSPKTELELQTVAATKTVNTPGRTGPPYFHSVFTNAGKFDCSPVTFSTISTGGAFLQVRLTTFPLFLRVYPPNVMRST